MNYFKILVLLFILIAIRNEALAFDNKKLNKETQEEVNKILALSDKANQNNYFLITNLDNCISCQLTAINQTLTSIKKSDSKANINIVLESENEKDSYYLKNNFPGFNFFEDNLVFLTTKMESNFILIRKGIDNKLIILKFEDLKDFAMKSYAKYLTSNSDDLVDSKKIQEDSTCYLNSIAIINNNDSELSLFDYNSKTLLSYNSDLQISEKLKFDKKYQFFIGKPNLFDTIIKNGFMIDDEILSVNKVGKDNYYVLFNRALIDIQVQPNSHRATILKSVLAKYKNDSLVDYCVLGINNYISAFSFKNKHLLLLGRLPNFGFDSTCFLFEIPDTNKFIEKKAILTKSKFEQQFHKKLDNLDFMEFFDMINENDYYIVSSKYGSIFSKIGDKYSNIKLVGRCALKEEYSTENSFYSDNFVFIIIKDNLNYYIQKYDIRTGKLKNEKIINRNINGDFLIELQISKYESGKLSLVNRRKSSRWFKSILKFD